MSETPIKENLNDEVSKPFDADHERGEQEDFLIEESEERVSISKTQPLAPELQIVADEFVNSQKFAIERGLMVRAGVDGVQAAERPDDFDIAADALIEDLRDDQVERMTQRARELLKESPHGRAVRAAGPMTLRWNSELSVSEQMEQLSLDERLARHPKFGRTAAMPDEKRPGRRLIDALLDLQEHERLPTPSRERLQLDVEAPTSDTPPRTTTVDTNFLSHLMELSGSGSGSGLTHGGTTLSPNSAVGPIDTKYNECGGINGPLGKKIHDKPVYDEDPKGRGIMVQWCEGGVIIWKGDPQAVCIHGPIFKVWQEHSGLQNPILGVPIMDQMRCADKIGLKCHFWGGASIYYSPAFDGHVVNGWVRNLWFQLDGEQGWLGYPTSDVIPSREPIALGGPFGESCEFDGGRIVYSKRYGAFAISEEIDALYQDTHAELGNLGYPVNSSNNPKKPPDKIAFEGGHIRMIHGQPQLVDVKSYFSCVLEYVEADKTTKEINKDEISLGITQINPLGEVTQHERMNLGQFNNGTFRYLKDYRNFALDLDAEPPQPWGRTFICIYNLAEIDGNGFDEFLLKMITALEAEIGKKVNEAATKVGNIVSAVFPILGFLVTVAIKAIAGYVLGKLWDLLKGGLKEDTIFKPVVLDFHLPNVYHYGEPLAEINGWEVLTDQLITSKAGGGTYRLRLKQMIDR